MGNSQVKFRFSIFMAGQSSCLPKYHLSVQILEAVVRLRCCKTQIMAYSGVWIG